MPEDPRKSFGDARVWDAIVAEMASRLADSLVVQVGDRLAHRVGSTLRETAATASAELATQTAALQSETSRTIAAAKQLEGRHAALQATVDSVAPGIEDSTRAALDDIETRLSGLTDHLLAMFSGRYLMVERRLLDTVLDRDAALLESATADLDATLRALHRVADQVEALALARRPLLSRLRGEHSDEADRLSANMADIARRVNAVGDRLATVKSDLDRLGTELPGSARSHHTEPMDDAPRDGGR